MSYVDLDPLPPFVAIPSTWLAQLLANTEALHDGSGFAAGAIGRVSLLDGLVKYRQGGSSGDASWLSPGTSNTNTSAKRTVIIVGAIGLSTAGTDVSVTFPAAFAYPPLVFPGVMTGNTANVQANVNSITTTGFKIRALEANGTDEIASWLAIGQI